MTSGILIRPDGNRFIFRVHDDEILAWDIFSDPSRGMTHKWKKLPKGTVVGFDIDDPPSTVSFQPVLTPFT